MIPTGWLVAMATRVAEDGSSGAEWAASLPRLVTQVLDDWHLIPAGSVRTGASAMVLPVTRDDDRFALKLRWHPPDTAAEALALRLWDGAGAARLIAADPGRGALLLEQLDPDHALADQSVDTDSACQIVGGLLRQLHVAAPPNVRSLATFLDEQLHGQTGVGRAGSRLPRRAVDRALGLATDLLARPDATTTLVHSDLRLRHVLAGDREPWLAINPRPLAGHPGVEVHPVLCSRVDELGTGAALRWSVRHRLEIVCDAAAIDEDLARYWSIVWSTIEAHRAAQDGHADQVSLQLALAKALDD